MLCVPNNLFCDLWETFRFVSPVVAVTAWQCPQGWVKVGCGYSEAAVGVGI